jgi:hypothetical protein
MNETSTPEPATTAATDWTVDLETGRSNSSQQYTDLVAEVERLIREGGGRCLSPAWARSTAALIMARLAHVHGLAPERQRSAAS